MSSAAAVPLQIAVVGHVNTGKTSLIATLSRRTDLAVSDGRTTLGLEEIEFRVGECVLLKLIDTPALATADESSPTGSGCSGGATSLTRYKGLCSLE